MTLGVHHRELDEVSYWISGRRTECLGTLKRLVLHRVNQEETGKYKQQEESKQLSDIVKITNEI